MNDDDIYASSAWQAYQTSIGSKYQDALTKAINGTKLDATLKTTSLEETVKEYELDKLFGVTPNVAKAAIKPHQHSSSTIVGKNPTSVWLDDPWDI